MKNKQLKRKTLEKLRRATKLKKNIGQISRKVKEGDEIKKTFDLFDKKLMRATKKTSKKNIAGKMFFISWNKLGFFLNVFLSPEIYCFFLRNQQQSYAPAG